MEQTLKEISKLMVALSTLFFLFFSHTYTVVAATPKYLYCDCRVEVGFALEENQEATLDDNLFIRYAPLIDNGVTNDTIFTFPGEYSNSISGRGFINGDKFGYSYAKNVFEKIKAGGAILYDEAGNYFKNQQSTNNNFNLYPFKLNPQFKQAAFVIENETEAMIDFNTQDKNACSVDIPSIEGYPSGIYSRVKGDTYIGFKMECADRYEYDINEVPDPHEKENTGQSPSSTSLKKFADQLNKLEAKTLPALIGVIIKGLMGIIGTVALVMMLYGGILWMTARGNSETTTKARDTILWAGLGIVVIFASYALVDFIFEIFR